MLFLQVETMSIVSSRLGSAACDRHRVGPVSVALVLLAVLVSAIGGASPASAELSSQPTTSWGVIGLGTGTQTDSIDSEVWAIEQIDNTLYVGGRFLQVTDGSTVIDQPYLAAFDATTGVRIPGFAPQLDNAVYALEAAPDGSSLFVGGSFSTVGGVSTGGLVALDPTTGTLDSWSGRIGGYNLVRSLDLLGDNLYVGGGFTSVSSSAGSNAASRIARFNWRSGVQDASWFPVVSGGTVWGIAASTTADRVYLAGYFTTVNGQSRAGGFAAVNQSNSANSSGVQAFLVNTKSVSRQYAYDVETVNGLVFVGGSEHYVQVLNEGDLSLRYFHMSQPSRGDYQDLEVVGNRVYASCHCRQNSYMESATGVIWWGSPPAGQSSATPFASGPNSWATAFNATTGLREASFVPNINSDGPGPWAIHGTPDGCLWLGGNITQASGLTQFNITRLCDPSGQDLIRPSTPGAPQIVSIGADNVSLTWNPSTDNVGVAGYRIFDAANDGVVADVPTNSAILTGLAPATYNFYGRAYDAAGNVSYRTGNRTVTITGSAPDTERPSNPSGLVSTGIGTDSASFSWNPATDNIGVVAYRLYDSTTNAQVLQVTATNGTITGLTPDTYGYYARAVDAAGNISYRSNIVNVTITG